MEVGFAIKGLAIGGFLSVVEASCVVSALFDGARQCEGGKMTGEFLRGFYSALREGRASIGDSNTVFYRRLRLTKLLEKRAGIKRETRARNTVYENFNEECEARKLPNGIKTRSVAADCKGRCGIAKPTIASGGDGVYAQG